MTLNWVMKRDGTKPTKNPRGPSFAKISFDKLKIIPNPYSDEFLLNAILVFNTKIGIVTTIPTRLALKEINPVFTLSSGSKPYLCFPSLYT